MCVLLNHSSQISSTVKRSGIERENKKDLTSRETVSRYYFIYSNHHTFDCHIFHGVSKIKIREVVICLNCIIGLSSTAENNSLCNHIKWWQIVLKIKSRKGIGKEGLTCNDIGHMHSKYLICTLIIFYLGNRTVQLQMVLK